MLGFGDCVCWVKLATALASSLGVTRFWVSDERSEVEDGSVIRKNKTLCVPSFARENIKSLFSHFWELK